MIPIDEQMIFKKQCRVWTDWTKRLFGFNHGSNQNTPWCKTHTHLIITHIAHAFTNIGGGEGRLNAHGYYKQSCLINHIFPFCKGLVPLKSFLVVYPYVAKPSQKDKIQHQVTFIYFIKQLYSLKAYLFIDGNHQLDFPHKLSVLLLGYLCINLTVKLILTDVYTLLIL